MLVKTKFIITLYFMQMPLYVMTDRFVLIVMSVVCVLCVCVCGDYLCSIKLGIWFRCNRGDVS